MMPYLSAHPIARFLFAATILAWVLAEGRRALRRRPEAANADRSSRLVVTGFWVAAFLLAWLARTRAPSTAFAADAATFGIGLALIWIGIALRSWAVRTLGRFFTIEVMTSADQPVISGGPYAFVRHPSYSGLLLIFAGIGVIYANWLSLAALTVLPAAGLVYRIRVEEAALSAALGEKYTEYAARRKRIIPFIW